jgi:DMSO/TMAO reductase YedYZ molybdopterin-dependent catalytic subunit
MKERLKVLDKLPVHKSKGKKNGRTHPLRVDGLVRTSLALSVADLERLAQQDLTDDFTCLEGWTVPKVRWGGVLLETVLSLADPLLEARYVQASAGDFSVPLSLDRARHALLALRLEDAPVPAEHGGPVRLVVPGGECFMDIKWLDHLDLRAEPAANTAKKAALRRLLARQPVSRRRKTLATT